jgi:hypothetical protein
MIARGRVSGTSEQMLFAPVMTRVTEMPLSPVLFLDMI